MILAVDLAAKFSAVVVLDADGGVTDQFDSWGKSAQEFVDRIVNWVEYGPDSLYIVIEDVPYGISNQKMTKSAFRLQGYILGQLAVALPQARWKQILFVMPSTWQRTFEGVWRGEKTGAETAARSMGYEAPDLLDTYADRLPFNGPARTKAKADLRKSRTDYIDAYLIARWAEDVLAHTDDPFVIAGVQPAYI